MGWMMLREERMDAKFSDFSCKFDGYEATLNFKYDSPITLKIGEDIFHFDDVKKTSGGYICYSTYNDKFEISVDDEGYAISNFIPGSTPEVTNSYYQQDLFEL